MAKIYVMTDLEGVTYVVREDQTSGQGREYEEACRLLTGDVNAAVEGALAGGATEVVVNDLHGARGGFNFVPELLHGGARYLTGGPRPCRHHGLDAGYDAAFLIGYHAMVGTQGAVLEHTMSTRVVMDVLINGRRVGEIGIDSAIVGYYGVPVVLVSGCRKAVEEAKELLGEIEGVIVKEGVSRNFAHCLPPSKTSKMIKEAAERAVGKRAAIKPLKFDPPVSVEVEFSHANYADSACRTENLERVDSRTVRSKGRNLLDALRPFGWL
ncbi:MAG: M55 family metallopeptidase [Candidatus Brockarchaeota archaeon]|nr:M55 family metallopeptidase [Candidatus Brockarchaeota archaeon]